MHQYDAIISKYQHIIDIYQNDDIQEIIQNFLNKIKTKRVQHPKFNQCRENEYLAENILNTINKLRNALQVLDSRMITNIGGKVAHYIDPEIPQWYLIQVWRG